jgi:hypothetical protein
MDSTEALTRLRDLVRGGNVNPIRERQNRSRDFAFFAASGKHNHMTDSDWAHLCLYVEAVVRTGSAFDAAGIRLSDGKFLELDRAKIGAAITDGFIQPSDPDGAVLRLNRDGWRLLIRRLDQREKGASNE